MGRISGGEGRRLSDRLRRARSGRRIFVGKEKAQIVQGKPLREGVLAQDVLDEGGFGALELADFLFDALFDEQPISDDLAALADAMGTRVRARS